MAIESPCPGCGVVLAVPDEHTGKQARCPECAALFVVPAKTESTQKEAPDTPLAASSAETAGSSTSATENAGPPIPVAEAPPPDHRQWWLKTPQGAVYGPISKDQLDAWCEEGRIADDCQLKHEEELAWRDATNEYPLLVQEAAPVAPFAMAEAVPPPQPQNLRPVIVLPHRGVIIVALGIAGWITVVCPVFGVIAWNMGNRDLELMYAGQMDASGMRITHLGRLLGLFHVLGFVAVLILSLAFAVIYLVMQ